MKTKTLILILLCSFQLYAQDNFVVKEINYVKKQASLENFELIALDSLDLNSDQSYHSKLQTYSTGDIVYWMVILKNCDSCSFKMELFNLENEKYIQLKPITKYASNYTRAEYSLKVKYNAQIQLRLMSKEETSVSAYILLFKK